MSEDDVTENRRRAEQAELNANAGERAALEAKYGQVWDTDQLRADFSIEGFLAPYVVVFRKADQVRGTLQFQHSPRLYFNFQADTPR